MYISRNDSIINISKIYDVTRNSNTQNITTIYE